MLIETIQTEIVRGKRDDIEVSLVKYGLRSPRIKLVRIKSFGEGRKPMFKSLGTMSIIEAEMVAECIQKISKVQR